MRQLCREHFCAYVRQTMRKTLSILYREEPYNAFCILDHEGCGYLTLSTFLDSYVAGRSGLTPEEITAYFDMQNIFRGGEGRMTYAKFRGLFFPHMSLAGEDPVLDRSFAQTKTV